jgi:hemerythrin-like domain-containing protein
MSTIHTYLSTDHRHCDESLALLEAAASKEKWSEVATLAGQFTKEMLRHFSCEENILFPAFEDATGMTQGPTMVMRMEHVQMKEMLGQFPEAIANKNSDRILGLTETLMIFIQQHNGKEEQMLYNMCDMHLQNQSADLIAEMKKIA